MLNDEIHKNQVKNKLISKNIDKRTRKRKQWLRLDIKKLLDMKKSDQSLQKMANEFLVTKNAIRKAIKRYCLSGEDQYRKPDPINMRVKSDPALRNISINQLKELSSNNKTMKDILNYLEHINKLRSYSRLPIIFLSY